MIQGHEGHRTVGIAVPSYMGGRKKEIAYWSVSLYFRTLSKPLRMTAGSKREVRSLLLANGATCIRKHGRRRA